MRHRRIGGLAYLGMAAALIAAPALVSRSWPADGSGAIAEDEDEGPGSIVGIADVEGWASEGFDELAAEASASPEALTWDEVRRLMERLGRADLRYGLKIRYLYADGGASDQIYLRRPYHEPQHAAEFLRVLRGGPGAAVGLAPGARSWRIGMGVGGPDAPLPEAR